MLTLGHLKTVWENYHHKSYGSKSRALATPHSSYQYSLKDRPLNTWSITKHWTHTPVFHHIAPNLPIPAPLFLRSSVSSYNPPPSPPPFTPNETIDTLMRNSSKCVGSRTAVNHAHSPNQWLRVTEAGRWQQGCHSMPQISDSLWHHKHRKRHHT